MKISIDVPTGQDPSRFYSKVMEAVECISPTLSEHPPKIDAAEALVELGAVEDKLDAIRKMERGRVYLGERQLSVGDKVLDIFDLDYRIVLGYETNP